MKVVVVADSHAPRRWKGVPHILALELVDADLVLHAGDVCVPEVLDELAAFAPVITMRLFSFAGGESAGAMGSHGASVVTNTGAKGADCHAAR